MAADDFKPQNLPLLRKYLQEAVIAALAVAVGFLFIQHRDLEQAFRVHLEGDAAKLTEVIVENNQILKTLNSNK